MSVLLYKITNITNNKCYIGITTQSFNSRMTQHKHRSKNGKHALALAIKKYGWENFNKEIVRELGEGECSEEAEVCAIKKYNSNANGGHGYNRTGGGGGITGYRFTSEDKIKIAKAAKESAYNIWGYNRRAQLCLFPTHTGFKHSDETKNKISEALKNNKTRKWVSKLEKEDAEDIKFLRSSGLSYKKIGEIFDVVPQTIFYFCKRNMI